MLYYMNNCWFKQYFIKEKSALGPYVSSQRIQHFSHLGKSFSYIDTLHGSEILLFIHGNPTSKEIWFPIIQEISSNARCIAIDLFDENPESPYLPSLNESSELMIKFLEYLKISETNLVTHDWGVTVGLKILAKKPEMVSKFIFMEGLFYPVNLKHYFFVPWFLAMLGKTPFLNHVLLVHLNIFVRWLIPMGCITKLPQSWYKFFLGVYQNRQRREGIKNWISQIPTFSNSQELDFLRQNFYESPKPKLAFIVTPGLAMKKKTVLEIKMNCRHLSVKDLGNGIHFIPLDYPAEIAREILRFFEC